MTKEINNMVLDHEGMEREVTDIFTNADGKKIYELDYEYLRYFNEIEFL